VQLKKCEKVLSLICQANKITTKLVAMINSYVAYHHLKDIGSLRVEDVLNDKVVIS